MPLLWCRGGGSGGDCGVVDSQRWLLGGLSDFTAPATSLMMRSLCSVVRLNKYDYMVHHHHRHDRDDIVEMMIIHLSVYLLGHMKI